MKICLLTPYYSPIKGGISTYVVHLSENLIKKEHDTYIITKRGIKDVGGVYVADTSKVFFIFKALLKIRDFRPDVLHSHAHWYLLVPCAIYKIIKPKTVIVHTFHTDSVDEVKGIKRIVMNTLLSRCDVLTFVSEYLQNKTIEYFDINVKTKVIYGGVSAVKLEETEINQFKRNFKLGNCFPVISFVGALSWKMKAEGVKILVKAFKQVSTKYPDSRLLIVGDGIYRKEIECLVDELDLTSKVIFTGFVDNVYIPLAVSDIYAHISLQEAFGLAVLEAMNQKKTVIATKVGGIPEIINDNENGKLVPSDPMLIAEEIIKLVEDTDKATFLAENALNTIRTKFTWDQISEQFIKIYRGCNGEQTNYHY